METMTASQPVVFTKEFRSAYTDVLSQAINGEIAKYLNGVLTLNLPKKVEVKEAVKEITIL